MPGKVFALPDPSLAKIIDAPPVPVTPLKETTAKKPAGEPKPPQEVAQKPQPAPVQPTKPVETKPEPPPRGPGYMVQVGSFVLKMGVDSLMERMRRNGLKPRLGVYLERVPLNNVQAGPFTTLEEAKTAEAILKAHGMNVAVEELWNGGFIISLSKSLLLGYAMQDMEKAESLDVKPLRLVKIEADLPVRKVFLGPFPTKKKATEMGRRISRMGLATPVIKPYTPPQKEEKNSEGGG